MIVYSERREDKARKYRSFPIDVFPLTLDDFLIDVTEIDSLHKVVREKDECIFRASSR